MTISGLFRDEFANFLIKSRKLVSKDSAILRISFPMLKDSWGEDFVPIDQFPKSFCVMAGKNPSVFKPYTPIDVTNDHLDLLVKGYKTGKVSSSLFESKEGDKVVLKGPRDKLNLRVLDSVQRILAFAGGTGIAPIYQVLKYIKSKYKDNMKVQLFYANKTRDDILLKDELDKLLLEMPGLEIKNIIEAERGYLNESDMKNVDTSDYVMVCGPKGFNELLLGNKETGQIGLLNKIPIERIYKF